MRLGLSTVRRRGLDDGTVPLVNIGFLLLLHLLVAGELGGADPLPLVLPNADHAERRDKHLPVQIDVAPGDPVLVRINQQVVALDDIKAYLLATDRQQPPFLRADASLTTAQLSTVISALRQAGHTELRLATRPIDSP